MAEMTPYIASANAAATGHNSEGEDLIKIPSDLIYQPETADIVVLSSPIPKIYYH